ncbi:MAG: hypothetical protein ACI4V4_02735 [Eubacterium sp.]
MATKITRTVTITKIPVDRIIRDELGNMCTEKSPDYIVQGAVDLADPKVRAKIEKTMGRGYYPDYDRFTVESHTYVMPLETFVANAEIID